MKARISAWLEVQINLLVDDSDDIYEIAREQAEETLRKIAIGLDGPGLVPPLFTQVGGVKFEEWVHE